MPRETVRPDVAKIMSGLKDFQRQTVEHVFRQMYEVPKPTHRFLVADEVGLGKTLVARGVIAKALDHLWDNVDRLDVVYICSNSDIARQNVERLNVLGEQHVSIASRLTMLPAELSGMKSRKVNFISFTPGTSFELKSNTGRSSERVLLYWMLRETWKLGRTLAPLYVLQGQSNAERFRDEAERFAGRDIDEDLQKAFQGALAEEERRAVTSGMPSLRQRFDHLCGVFSRFDSRVTKEDRVERSRFVGDLRRVLAATCIKALQPDLIILDEFQRFKNLLGDQDEAALLAQELFNYEDEQAKARVLLLSATPYKMYTTAGGASDDDHYADFLATLRFLQSDPAATEEVRETLNEYRRLLLRLGRDTLPRLGEMKGRLEQSLRKVMVRTERLAVSKDRNGMLAEVQSVVDSPRPRSINNYLALQKIARMLEHPNTVEYWKAAPYLLNFMMDYKFKREFVERTATDGGELANLLMGDPTLCADSGLLRGKAELDPPHARLRWLVEDTVGRGLWQLLWLPPAMPYYELGEPFASLARQGVTKRLLFSAWKVVPRAVASLLSYEAERRCLEQVATSHRSVDRARQSLSEPLKFTRSDGRLTGMAALGVLYPSFVLASMADPLDPYYRSGSGRLPSKDELLAAIERRLAPLLSAVLEKHQSAAARGAADERWYWAAPILLDAGEDAVTTRQWISRPDAARRWANGSEEADDSSDEDESPIWVAHVDEAQRMLTSKVKLGRAPADLGRVVALQALAGPGVVALRSISRITGGEAAQKRDYVRDAAGAVAWAIRNLFNLPESIALVRSLYDDGTYPYWHALMEYSAAGGLQSVLDEYQHILPEFVGLVGATPEKIADRVSQEVRQALGLRTSAVAADEIRVNGGGSIAIERRRLRARFAVRFGDTEADDGEERTRTSALRSAFNSPFWPFVLATTTVGQEGLDFHQYCHAVVHWNLPSNPVDLEQREGRVHRYKGHAVRKNVAARYAGALLSECEGGEEDPWHTLFDMAKRDRPRGSSDIVPFWSFTIEGGAKVERHVPALPLSREVEELKNLRHTLAMYRMVFGQPRQDELLDYLLRQLSHDQAQSYLTELRIDLSPSLTAASC